MLTEQGAMETLAQIFLFILILRDETLGQLLAKVLDIKAHTVSISTCVPGNDATQRGSDLHLPLDCGNC